MQRPPRHRFTFHAGANKKHPKSARTILSPRLLLWLFLLSSAVTVVTTTLARAQNDSGVKQQEDQVIQDFTLPKPPPQAPVYRPQPAPVRPAPRQEQPEGRSRRVVRQQEQQEAAPRPAPQVRRSRPQAPIVEDYTPAPQTRRRSQQRIVDEDTTPAQVSTSNQEESVANDTTPPNQYILEFNRSPVVGSRFRLQGVYSEARLGFTRPRDWNIKSAKVLIRFQHSPALFANRSNLTVRLNDTSIGSIPLNRKQSEVGSVLLNVPPNLIQNFNSISLVAQQNNSATCTDPDDQTLWTEVLPDSKLILNYQPRPIPLDFSSYPYPFFDDRSLDPTQIAYLLPAQINDSWMTGAARFQAALGRLADFRPIDTTLIKNITQVQANQRLVIIGTPEEQPALRYLKLPFKISGNQVLDGNQSPLPDDVGVLMVATTKASGVPVLVVTGNGPDGVAKAVQSLVQSKNRKIATGQGIFVTKLEEAPTPSLRNWPRYLPEKNSFNLKELPSNNDKPFEDVTVRGSGAPPVEFDFRALPDDRFTRGSSMTLRYSYGPQVNPRTSAVQVFLNNNAFIGGARLTSESGESGKTLNVNLPENLIGPTSKIQVFFRMNPREPGDRCGSRVPDQQLTGTVHADTSFNLNRETSVQLPDLKLLQAGYPFAAPQDLSSTAIVVPDSPSNTDLMTLMGFSERLGRLSQADSVKLKVYTTGTLGDERKQLNLVAIGIREKFPFPEVLESGGFKLGDVFSRQWQQNQLQALPDEEGVIKEILSPYNSDRVLLALTAQTENGLDRVRQILKSDPLFFQLQKDTVLVSASQQDPSAYDPDAYDLEFLEQAQQRRIENTSLLSKVSRLLQEQWFLLPLGIVGIALLLYGIGQLYLKRLTVQDKK